MSFLESPPQITSLSTKCMHERGGVPQLDKYPAVYHSTLNWTATSGKAPPHVSTILHPCYLLPTYSYFNWLILNPRPDSVSPPSPGEGWWWCDLPCRFQTKHHRALRKRPADCSRRVLTIGGIIFGPRLIFDPVITAQRSKCWKFYDISTSWVHMSKTIYRRGMEPSPACSPLNSAQTVVFWCISV